MTNSDRLQEIRERAEKATEGPWACWDGWGPISGGYLEGLMAMARIGPSGGNSQSVISASGATKQDIYAKRPDAEFIAASREDIPFLLQLVTEQREVLDSAVRFIESALVICARSCNPGDGLHVSWGEDICKAARALGPLNALEELRQKNEAKGYRKQERPM